MDKQVLELIEIHTFRVLTEDNSYDYQLTLSAEFGNPVP